MQLQVRPLIRPNPEGPIFEKEIPARSVGRRSEPVMTHVLVVEDDPSVGAAIQMMLDRGGCSTVCASDAVLSGFQTEGRGQLIMACGTGKTCVACG